MARWSKDTYAMVREVLEDSDLEPADLIAVAGRFAARFADDSPRFDVARFLVDAGLDPLEVDVQMREEGVPLKVPA